MNVCFGIALLYCRVQRRFPDSALRVAVYESVECALRAWGGASVLRSVVLPVLAHVVEDVKLPSTFRVDGALQVFVDVRVMG